MRVCAVIISAGYDESWLWYSPPDIIAFTRRRGIVMEVSFGFTANVREI